MKDYIQFPTGDKLNKVVDEFNRNGKFHSVLEKLMGHTCQYLHQITYTLITITVRGGILC